MIEKDYLDSRRSCYSLAHTIAANGRIQQKLVEELNNVESSINEEDAETQHDHVIKAMLKVLLSNFT